MPLEEAFASYQPLHTPRLLLREVCRDDVDGLYTIKSDPNVTSRYGREPHASPGQTLAWIEGVLSGLARRESILWVVAPNESSPPDLAGLPALLGSVVLWNFGEETRCVELGYELHPAAWGKGVTSEACTAVIGFAFEGMGVNRIEACPLAGNPASSRVLEKLGFTFEGRLRQRVHFRGRYEDMLYYSLLREEWLRNTPPPADQPI